nr:hypothetical protein [Candidatus Njordarchaeum guaymaensis]
MTENQTVPLEPLTRPQLIQLLAEIGNALPERVESIAVGRTSLVLQGIKPATNVADLIFLSDDQFKCCVGSLKSLGYMFQTSGRWVRFVKEASIDLFLNRVLLVSAYMLERAGKLEVDTGKLLVRLLIPQDVFLLSSLSGHSRDLDDMKTIIEKETVDWDVLLYEVKERMIIGSSRRVPLSLAYSLERLRESGKRIPALVQERLLEMLLQQSPVRT